MDIKLLCLLLQATVLFSATFAASSWQNAIQISLLNNRVRLLSNRIKTLEADPVRKIMKGHTWWEEWSNWGGCYSNCARGGRVQTRSRKSFKLNPKGGKVYGRKYEYRPCNAVQYAGCIRKYGLRDAYFGVTYDFADQLAQATCTAMARVGYINAVRRKCSKFAPTCAVICKHLGLKCFNQLHVYRNVPILRREDVYKKGLQMYKYGHCSGNICGPNFCCCQS